jgi:spectinomycin phosphotransferase
MRAFAMREQPSIPEEHLRACLQEQYDLIPVMLEFLPRGLDYHAGVYRVVSEQGTPYLLKVKSGSLYEQVVSFLAISAIKGSHQS